MKCRSIWGNFGSEGRRACPRTTLVVHERFNVEIGERGRMAKFARTMAIDIPAFFVI